MIKPSKIDWRLVELFAVWAVSYIALCASEYQFSGEAEFVVNIMVAAVATCFIVPAVSAIHYLLYR